MKPDNERSSSATLIILVVGIILLIVALFFHVVVTPSGPTRMMLIAKPYATLRLCFVYLPSYVEANTKSLTHSSYLEFQLITDPLIRHFVSELWRRGALQRMLSI